MRPFDPPRKRPSDGNCQRGGKSVSVYDRMLCYELSLLIRANDTIVTLWWNRFACGRQTLDAS